MAETQTEEQQQAPVIQSTMSAAQQPSVQLTSTDILSRMQANQPFIYQGEKLPEVPKGVPAKGFYGQFPGGASIYSKFRRKSPQPSVAPSTPPTPPTTPPTTEEDTAPTATTPTLPAVEVQDDSMFDYTDTATTPSVYTQMDEVLPAVKEEETTFLDVIRDDDFEIGVELDKLTKDAKQSIVDMNKRIEGFSTELIEGIGISYDETLAIAKRQLADLKEFGIVTPTYNYLIKGWTDFTDNLVKLGNPDTYTEALSYFGKGFAKATVGKMLGLVATRLGAGAFGGPIGMLVTNLIAGVDWSETQIGMPGQYETLTPRAWDADGKAIEWDVTYTPTTLTYFDEDGIARDPDGNQVFTSGPAHDPSTGSPWFGTPTPMDVYSEGDWDIGGKQTFPEDEKESTPTIEAVTDKETYDSTITGETLFSDDYLNAPYVEGADWEPPPTTAKDITKTLSKTDTTVDYVMNIQNRSTESLEKDRELLQSIDANNPEIGLIQSELDHRELTGEEKEPSAEKMGALDFLIEEGLEPLSPATEAEITGSRSPLLDIDKVPLSGAVDVNIEEKWSVEELRANLSTNYKSVGQLHDMYTKLNNSKPVMIRDSGISLKELVKTELDKHAPLYKVPPEKPKADVLGGEGDDRLSDPGSGSIVGMHESEFGGDISTGAMHESELGDTAGGGGDTGGGGGGDTSGSGDASGMGGHEDSDMGWF